MNLFLKADIGNFKQHVFCFLKLKNTALHWYFKEPKLYRTLEKWHKLENIYHNFKHEKNWRKLKKKIGLNLKNIAQSWTVF